MEKRSNRNIPGKFDPNTCMDTILPKWSLKSVNNSKKKTQILSGSMTESKVLFHKEAKNKEDDKLNSYNIPKKFYKSPIIPSPNRNYRDNYVKSFPLDQSSTLRTYGPIEIPSLPQLTDSEMMNISLTSPIMNDRSKYDKKSDPRYLILDDSKLLPLMCFDNSEYERYSPEEWLELCKTGYSTFYNKGSWYWVPCEIKSYDKETERFHIDFTSFKVEKDVSRLNLRFDLENEEEFNMRLEEAVRLRNQTKYDLRYEYYVSTENIDLSPINPAWLDNIYIRMVSNTYLGLSKHKSRILEIGKEIIENYNLNMKRVSINTQLLFDDEKLDNYMKMDFKLPTNERTVNEYGKYQIGQLSFDDYQNEVAKSPQLLKKEIYKILHTIQELWMNRIGDILLVDLDNLKLPCKLSELVDKQINYCKSIVDLIREKWYLHVKDTIIDNLQTIYDFYIANKLDYDKTEMSRVLHLFDNVCRTYLQKILMRSVEKWTEFLYKYEPKDEASEYCRDSAEKVNPEYEEYMEKQRIVEEKKLEEIERQKQMEEEKKKGEKDRKRKTGRGIAVQEDFEEEVEEKEEIIVKVTECLLPLKYFYKRPESNTTWGSWDTNLFDIKLIPKESEITMSPTREELSKSLIRVIRNMVEKISTLNKIEPQIVPLVYLPPEPLLNLEDEESPIYYMREEINEYCELVSFLIEKSMIGPKSILDRYQLYADAIPTNAIEYGKPFDGVPDIETIRNEIEKFYIAKKNISKETYDEEPFGLCLLDCRKVKVIINSKNRTTT